MIKQVEKDGLYFSIKPSCPAFSIIILLVLIIGIFAGFWAVSFGKYDGTIGVVWLEMVTSGVIWVGFSLALLAYVAAWSRLEEERIVSRGKGFRIEYRLFGICVRAREIDKSNIKRVTSELAVARSEQDFLRGDPYDPWDSHKIRSISFHCHDNKTARSSMALTKKISEELLKFISEERRKGF
ncbi:MAG: hypothetical protein HY077_00410 [Elusimicrobia bacterium]|nr:hypothetical protein [Elusimicrobiota bacterium]